MPQQENKKKKSALFAPFAFLLVIAALIFVVSVFFNVSSVEVDGNNFYTAQEVAEASGIQEGDNLFFINRFTAASRIFSRLPYVEGISIEKKLPGSVIVHVTESEAIAYISGGDGWWAIDRSGKLLSQVDPAKSQELLKIEGLSAQSPAQGDIVSLSSGDAGTVDFLADILSQIYALGLRQEISAIDFSDPDCPVFDYVGRFNVRLGGSENVPYKFQLLISVVNGLQPGDCGTIDLSIDSAAHLSYD